MAGRIDFDTIGTDNGTNYFASSLMLFRAPELSVADTPAPQPLIHTSFITASSTLLFPGATLANYHSAAALMAGGSFDDDYADAHIFYFVNDGATASFRSALPLAAHLAHDRHGPVSGCRGQRHLLRQGRTH